jgi:hypothetical protein
VKFSLPIVRESLFLSLVLLDSNGQTFFFIGSNVSQSSFEEVLSYCFEWLMDLACSDFSGKSNTTLKELCDIVWTIEADLTAGQLLYITGDPDVLGCWDPEMAILMSPSEHTNLWKAEVKVMSPSCDKW